MSILNLKLILTPFNNFAILIKIIEPVRCGIFGVSSIIEILIKKKSYLRLPRFRLMDQHYFPSFSLSILNQLLTSPFLILLSKDEFPSFTGTEWSPLNQV